MRRPEWTRALVFCLLLAQPLVAAAERPPMLFRQLTVQNGLSQNTVTSIHQDARGFVWLGTENGLNRYDGYHIERYNADPRDPESLQGALIYAIDEDRDGNLWLATSNNGIARWDRDRDAFHTFRHEPDDPASLAGDAVRDLLVDQAGTVWVGTMGAGLSAFDPATGRAKHYRHVPGDPGSLSSNSVNVLYQDRSGMLWIGTSAGLNRLDPKTGQITRYRHSAEAPASLSHDSVTAIVEDYENALWVGTAGGLNRLDAVSGTFIRYRHRAGDSRSLPDDGVRALLEDQERRLWVGTRNGLAVLDRQRGEFQTFREEVRPGSLSDSDVGYLYQDRSGLLWVGTRSGGANVWNPRGWSMGHHVDDWLRDTNVAAFASDSGGLWVGTFHGLARFEDGEVVARYGAEQLGDERVMALLTDRSGNLWIGTMHGGLSRLDPVTGDIDRFRHDPKDPGSLGADGVMTLFEDRQGRIWAGTFGGGANRYDPGRNSFMRISVEQGLNSRAASAIVQDRHDAIWIATPDAGLNRLDPVSGRIDSFLFDAADPRSLGNDQIYSLHSGPEGRLWIGTAGSGLNVLNDPQRPDLGFDRIRLEDGLPSDLIYGILSDAEGQIWVSTNNGVARLAPDSGDIKQFHRAHGLQGEEFNFGAYHRSAAGVVYFGGANGFNAISPERIEHHAPPPPVVLTEIRKMNRPVATTGLYAQQESLHVRHDESVVTFEFAALDFTAPEKNRYAYLLEGFDHEWTEAGSQNRATYTNLDAGDYVFRVRAANSDGVWNEEGLSLSVSVAPAPWLTGWAYAGYALLASLLIGAAAREYRRRRRIEQSHRDRLYDLAYFDQLTGTPNRALVMQRLTDAIATGPRALALVYIDLDDFKRINDTLGHQTGDEVLKLVTRRLRQVAEKAMADRPGVKIDLGRLGGDEFILLIEGLASDRPLHRLAGQVIEAHGRPFEHAGRSLVVTPSIGVAVYPTNGRTPVELLKNADAAMYEAKNAGRNEYCFYSPEMNARAAESLALEGELRHALASDELYMVYQPKVDLATGIIVGCEALVRWQHPDHGAISPGTFIPVAERSGLILDLDRWVVTAVCAQLRTWLEADVSPVPVALNLSGKEFTSLDLVASLTRATARAGVPASLLELEITESVLMHNADAAREVLGELRQCGFHIAVDDFGTGYSSLSYLKNFPLSSLKIDRAFVVDVCTSPADQAICAAVIDMAHGMRLRVVAEGIETAEQADYLASRGCDQAQGFHFHRPMLPDALLELLRQRDEGLSARSVTAGL